MEVAHAVAVAICELNNKSIPIGSCRTISSRYRRIGKDDSRAVNRNAEAVKGRSNHWAHFHKLGIGLHWSCAAIPCTGHRMRGLYKVQAGDSARDVQVAVDSCIPCYC